jgi:hypothetical protein
VDPPGQDEEQRPRRKLNPADDLRLGAFGQPAAGFVQADGSLQTEIFECKDGIGGECRRLASLHIEPPVFKRLCPEKCRTCQTARCRCRTQDRSCRLANRSRLAWTLTCLYIRMRNISFLPVASANEPFRRLRCPRQPLAYLYPQPKPQVCDLRRFRSLKQSRLHALPPARPRSPAHRSVRDPVGRSALERVPTSPRGSRPTLLVAPKGLGLPPPFLRHFAIRCSSISEGTQ